MKQSLGLKQSQKLTMVPQLQQAIRLLQMSATELSAELQYAHETNPLLEINEYGKQADGEYEEVEDNLNAINSESTVAYDPDQVDLMPADLAQLQFDQLVDPDKFIWDDPQNYAPVDQRPGDQRSSDYRRTSDHSPNCGNYSVLPDRN